MAKKSDKKELEGQAFQLPELPKDDLDAAKTLNGFIQASDLSVGYGLMEMRDNPRKLYRELECNSFTAYLKKYFGGKSEGFVSQRRTKLCFELDTTLWGLC